MKPCSCLPTHFARLTKRGWAFFIPPIVLHREEWLLCCALPQLPSRAPHSLRSCLVDWLHGFIEKKPEAKYFEKAKRVIKFSEVLKEAFRSHIRESLKGVEHDRQWMDSCVMHLCFTIGFQVAWRVDARLCCCAQGGRRVRSRPWNRSRDIAEGLKHPDFQRTHN